MNQTLMEVEPSPSYTVPCQTGVSSDTGTFSAARSAHPGGVNVAMADGSVHFVTDSIDINVWRSVGTRSGDETIDSDLF